MNSTQLLKVLAVDRRSYIFDDVGSGSIVMKTAQGEDMKLYDEEGRQIDSRVPYGLIEPLIDQGYLNQDEKSSRIYRISYSGLKAVRGGDADDTGNG